MTQTGLVRGIPAIDCSLEPLWGEPRNMAGKAVRFFRDPDSLNYGHPSQHLFKQEAADRATQRHTPEETIEMMDRFGVERAIIGLHEEDVDENLKIMESYPGRFYGKLAVDPDEGMEMVRKIEAYARGNPLIKALNVSPFSLQKPPNDKVYYPLYVKAIELDLPVVMTVGLPGPRVPGEIQNPIYLDEPLWFFPDLKVVMMHGGEPWEAMCVKLMLKWPNLYYMTSGFAPKHYPKDVIYYANTRGSDRVMYSGYYPGISYERLQSDLEGLELREHVWPKFLRENAIAAFKLG